MKRKIRASAYTQVPFSCLVNKSLLPLSLSSHPHRTIPQHGVNVKRLFRTIDRDRDGQVNLDEFSRAMRRGRISAYRMTEEQVSALFDLIDVNKNGSISLDEFAEFVGDDVR